MRLQLRDYQEDALARVLEAQGRGVRTQLGVAATGLGKTVMFSALAERMGTRTLVLAHRDELIEQAAAKMLEVWPDASVGVVKGARNEVGRQVVVASVQTLARQQRLSQLPTVRWEELAPDGTLGGLHGMFGDPFGLVVVDEAHHASADSYRRVLDHLGCGLEHGPLLLGVTATPDRADGKGLGDLFQEVAFSYDMLWGIRAGYLSDLRCRLVEVPGLDLRQVRVRSGDLDAGQAGHAMEDAGAPEVIAEAWHRWAADRSRTVVFTPTVAVALAVEDAFRARGIPAGHVDGSQPVEERRAVLRSFHRGDLRVVANCAVLTEGWDEPALDCVVVARPTRSRGLYVQMVGRGTRRHPDKTDCLVLDVVGVSEDLSLVTVPTLLGLEGKHREAMGRGDGTATGLVDAQEQEQVRLGLLQAREVELFGKMRAQGIAWVGVHRAGELCRYHRPLGKGQPTVVLVQVDEDQDQWLAGVQDPDGSKRVLIRDVPQEMAQGVAEDAVRKLAGASTALVDADARWRSKPPTPKQLAAAKRMRVAVDPEWNAGQLSDALGARMERRRVERGQR